MRTAIVLVVLATAATIHAAPAGVSFVPSAQHVDCYDFVEIAVNVDRPDVANPFTDASVEGQFAPAGGPAIKVEGFCDSPDGRVFRIRFMPTRPGDYTYSVVYRQGTYEATYKGRLTARSAGRQGLVRVDKEHPWHFVWAGTGEHYFWNGTTTYWLLGWDDETIRRSIDRLAGLKVNRLRVAICGRVKDGRAWYENVFPTEKFSFLMNPWVAQRPDSVENPGFDVTRFNLPHWQKIERTLRHARDKDMVISIIFYVDGRRPGVDPFKERMGQEDEQRYYRYGVARLAAFSNVMWDVTNEYHLFRNEDWTNKMGAFIRQCDPYDHVMSVHGHGKFPFRTSEWADFAMYQSWDESGGYRFMLNNRLQQQQIGRPIPQVNEEYGYEDHYPARWGGGRTAPARAADNRRRLAWGMYMAGGYQTTGERADTGTGWGSDTGGGWINGRGDDSMTMLEGYGHIVDFFTALPWWQLHPDNDFFQAQARTVIGAGLTHVVYTRTSEGKAALYVDGASVAASDIGGDVSNWDQGLHLVLGNELTGDRPWLGDLHRVALYARALNSEEIRRFAKAGRREGPAEPLVLYDFRAGGADVVRDMSKAGEPLDLKIKDPSAVQWLDGGGLRIVKPTLISSSGPATRLVEAVQRSKAVTIEAWIRPANLTQAGPARIVTVSKDAGSRNLTLGQKAGAYEMRFRTTRTSPNGEPALSTPGGDDALPSVVGLRSEKGDLAVLYFVAGGRARLKSDALGGAPRAQWFNPRTGQWVAATPDEGGAFLAPDDQDWVLLLRNK
jgi:hypothetical protein